MSETPETVSTEPRILHQGRYRLYQKPDGGIHLVYQREDKEEPDHFELPGAMRVLLDSAAQGNLSPMDMMRELMKLRGSM